MFAPRKLTDPPTEVVRLTLAGRVILPSLLLIVRLPNPSNPPAVRLPNPPALSLPVVNSSDPPNGVDALFRQCPFHCRLKKMHYRIAEIG